jgi:hypothetical protein
MVGAVIALAFLPARAREHAPSGVALAEAAA